MNKHKIIFPLAVIALLSITSCKKNEKTPIAEVDCTDVKYSTTVEPILSANCYSCHSSTSPDGALSNYEEVKVYVDNGRFKNLVLTEQTMPVGKKLTSEQLGIIQCWLNAGAPDN